MEFKCCRGFSAGDLFNPTSSLSELLPCAWEKKLRERKGGETTPLRGKLNVGLFLETAGITKN